MKTRLRTKSTVALRQRVRETASLAHLAEEISSSLECEDILGHAYKSFRGLLPYDRIGLSLVTAGGRAVQAIGTRSNARKICLPVGYRAPLKGSSLARILETGKPRIINDLEEYLSAHPRSDSTRRIVSEGIRSNLTYPLIAQGKPVGFIFFSSRRAGAYAKKHIDSFRRVATLLSLAVEKARLYKELEEADEMKNRLMGIAAHDLGNPLTVVIGYLALMQEEAGSEAFKEQLTIVLRNCKKMRSIIDSLLDSSLVHSRGFELSLRRLDLREFLSQIRADNQLIAEAKAIRLELDLPPTLPSLTADRFRLLQTFDNLISNAIKYSPPNTVATISARVAADAVEIAIADQGQGIPGDELSLLFKEFGRTSAQPTAGERSTGLGLATAYRIVKAHGGTIRVQSRTGAGTTFIVSLPLRAPKGGRILFGQADAAKPVDRVSAGGRRTGGSQLSNPPPPRR